MKLLKTILALVLVGVLADGLTPRPLGAHFGAVLELTKEQTICGGGDGCAQESSPFLDVGMEGSIKKRSLLAFDLVGQIPEDARIERAFLALYLTAPSKQELGMYQVLSAWEEGATWEQAAASGSNWKEPGGDFGPQPRVTIGVEAAGLYLLEAPALIVDVQRWVNDPSTNFGWIVLGAETAAGPLGRLGGSQQESAGWRPKLFVEYGIGQDSHRGGWGLIKALYAP